MNLIERVMRAMTKINLAASIGLAAWVLAAYTSPAAAHDFKLGPLRIEHPYATPTPPGAANGAAYLRGVRNTGEQPDRLVGASTSVTRAVEIHRSSIDAQNVMRMREIDGIELPPKSELRLRHGGPSDTVGNNGSARAAMQPVSLRFAANVNGQPFACGQTYTGIGRARSTITPSDFRFYVSEVALVDETGRAVPVALAQDGIWQLDDIALLDFENGTGPCRNGTTGINTEVRGSVPAGRYVGLRFTLGLPFARNHGDATLAPSPLNLTAMFWSWQGGYKFVKFDNASSGKPSAPAAPGSGHGGAAASGFSVHLGSTMCAAPSRTEAPKAECANPNPVAVAFDRFDVATQTIVADIGTLLAGANVDVNAANSAPGCMSFPGDADCPPVMSALGLAYGGAPAPRPQRLFAVR